MIDKAFRHVYGPVASRRLGSSLGVDLVPLKTCTYDCIYCQLGRTNNRTLERRPYVDIGEVIDELGRKLEAERVPDYITLSGSGEPTLHSELGSLLSAIRRLTTVPVAILTNGSLLWEDEVRKAVRLADLVLPSLDAGDEPTFRRVNRPHRDITFDRMVQGLEQLTREFAGAVWLEVFLLDGITANLDQVARIAKLAERIAPKRVQLNTVARPPCEPAARRVDRLRLEVLAAAFQNHVELISEEAAPSQAVSPDTSVRVSEILDLLRRRPCTVQDICAGLGLFPLETTKQLEMLIERGDLEVVRSNGSVFFEARRGE
jgi:wyosine [tRNA(Phe)-imidazoG37] synthetase (radical SAM superfamily)